MSEKPEVVFDTGPLSHFARADWLGILKAIVGDDRKAVIPDLVERELAIGTAKHPHLERVLRADWIEHRTLSSSEEMAALGVFSARLVVGQRNLGEAGVLAYATANGALAVLDDGAARKAASDYGVTFEGTLGLMCGAIRAGLLTVALVSHIADDLMRVEYRLPFGPGGFERWAKENDLV